MQKYNGQLIRQFASSVSGNAASGVAVTVRRQSDGAIATLYADNNTAGATLSNPLTTSAVGHFAFYAADGVYTLTFSDTTPQQVIQLQDLVGLQTQFENAVLNAGYIPSGTFSAGATLTQANQVLSDGSSYWRWDGALPKTVTAGSAPTPTGVGGWVLISDGGLRDELADTDSTVLIAGFQARQLKLIDCVKNLVPVENIMMNVTSFYAGGNTGGGEFYYNPTASKADSGKIKGDTLYIAPEAVAAWDGTSSGIDGLWGWTGTGSGCYALQREIFDVLVFGADPSGTNESYKHFGWYAKAFDGNGGYGTINIPSGFYRVSTTIPNLTHKIGIKGSGSSNTFLQCYNTGTTPVIVSSAAMSGTNALTTYSGFSLVSQVANGYGFNIQDSAYVLFEDVYTENFAGHWLLDSVLTSTFNKCVSRFGPAGAFGLWAKNTGTSNPNALTFVGSTFSSLGGLGLRLDNPSRISYIGGSIEACGSGSNAGVVINDAGGQGAAAFNFQTYFEGNGGIADVWINMSATSDPFTGVFDNCAFNRLNSSFATNNIRLTQAAGSKLAVIKVGNGCAFQTFGTYTPSSARKNVLIDSASGNFRYVDDGSNLFTSSLEIPEVSPAQLTYGASVAVDMSKYSNSALAHLTITDGSAFTIQNPTGAKVGDILNLFINNVFGAPGAVTFGSFYRLASAFTAPPLNNGSIIQFQATPFGLWVELSRSGNFTAI